MKQSLVFRIGFVVLAVILILVSGFFILRENQRQQQIQQCERPQRSILNETSNAQIVQTQDLLHSVNLDEIQDYNLVSNAIPSLTNPQFKEISSLNAIPPKTPGIGLEINGESRFYPFNILIWHNLVNDCVSGIPVVVSYCPLCQTGVVYNRTVADKILEFEVSNAIWLENILMKDTQTNSLWSTILGESVTGSYSTTLLEQVPSNITTLDQWQRLHPDSLILSTQTGYARPYDAIIDYSPTIAEDAPKNYLQQFVLINRIDLNTMYILQPEGETILNDDIVIEFFEDEVVVTIDNELYEDFIVTPRYVWENIFQNAQIYN